MNYVLLSDGCPSCTYAANAFSLLEIPLQHCQAIQPEQLDTAKALIICQNMLAKYNKKMNAAVNRLNLLVVLLQNKDNQPSTQPARKHLVEPMTADWLTLRAPFNRQSLTDILHMCTQHTPTPSASPTPPALARLVGKSAAIARIKHMIQQVTDTNSTVLILGASGTGKDVIASCIHMTSNRHDKPFVPVNCGAIPADLMESELFGHEKGAFTGAYARRVGRFELAAGGTLFLDEIGDMPMPMQVKLLRVIQERKIDRVGGTQSIDVNVRIIAATNKNLTQLIEEGTFREDLYYRLNVFPIEVPALRERSDDIPELVDFHLQKIHLRLNQNIILTDPAYTKIADYPWPGNIRELQNFLERLVILYPNQVVSPAEIEYHLPQHPSATHAAADAQHTRPAENFFSSKIFLEEACPT